MLYKPFSFHGKCGKITSIDKTRGEDLQQEDKTNTADGDQGTKVEEERRKRINRIKIELMILLIILLLLPTILCIILGFRVGKLQKQVDALLSMQEIGANPIDELEYSNEDKHYAYAAVQEKALTEEIDEQVSNENISGGTGQEESVNLDQPDEAVAARKEAETTASKKEAETSAPKKEAANTASKKEAETSAPKKEAATSVPKKATATPTAVPIQKGRYSGKKVYLTFDDGPSIYTDDILDILEEYEVKATFFVIGQTDDFSKKMYQRIVEEGHTLGMHSYSHKYSEIYNSLEDFEKDFTKLWKLLYDTTGYEPSIFRFPGGSDNLVNKYGMGDFIRYLNDAGFVYFDWNVENGDAKRITYTKEQLIDNVLSGVEIKTNAIVLMHDARDKKTTVDSLPALLDILISEGAQILPLDNEVTPIQMIKAESIK